MDKIAVLIPCYNECKTVKKVIEDFKRELPGAVIYVYDNNSTDGTDKIAKEAGAIVRYERKQGKGNVVRTMFREIDAECYIITDGDDTYPAEFAREMCDYVLNKKSDMVIGDRLSSTYFKENKRPFHSIGNLFLRNIINRIYKSDIIDVTTGYRAFSYLFAKTFSVLSKGFEIETEMTIHSLERNMQIDNVVIDYRNRPEGSFSKLNTYSDGYRAIKTIISLYKNSRPLSFFTWIAFVLAFMGILFLLPVLLEYFQTGLVPKIPTFLASIFFFIASLQAFFAGMILQNIVNKDKKDFEFRLQIYEEKLKNVTKSKEDI